MLTRIIRETLKVSLIIFFVFLNLYFIKSEAINTETKYYLEVVNKKSGIVLIKIEVSFGDKFYLEYVNSRDLNPIIDTFAIREDGIFCLLTEEYPWYGVGQEYHASKDIKFTDKLVIVNVNKEMKKLSLRVAFTVEQKIKYKEKEFILSALTNKGDPVDIIIDTERDINDK